MHHPNCGEGPDNPGASTAKYAGLKVGHVSQATNPKLGGRGGPIGGTAGLCARLLLFLRVEPVALQEPACVDLPRALGFPVGE